MKRTSTVFLQVVVVLFGIGALAFMLWEPHLEGRNARATFVEIYFKDPFLAYAYTASMAFYLALFQAFKLLGYIGRDRVFTPEAVQALKIIKYCAMTLVGFIGGALAYLGLLVRGTDDIAGGVFIGLILIFLTVVTGTTAAVLQHLLQRALDMKAENDLTV